MPDIEGMEYFIPDEQLMAEEEEEAKVSLRAVNMSDCEASELEEDFLTKGFVHFHWGGFPLECHNLPEKGQRVVFFNHETGGGFKLYLMIFVKEEDMDGYIKSHEDDFIGQAEDPLPSKSCIRLYELFDIDTDLLQ